MSMILDHYKGADLFDELVDGEGRIRPYYKVLADRLSRLGVEVFHDMKRGLDGVDVVMMLRLQRERMSGALAPSAREYFHFFGLDEEKLAFAAPGALVMHPGPMNRGVEIDSMVADGPQSVIQRQVTYGVAVRMAVLEHIARGRLHHG